MIILFLLVSGALMTAAVHFGRAMTLVAGVDSST
jgi:hypothetical protein